MAKKKSKTQKYKKNQKKKLQKDLNITETIKSQTNEKTTKTEKTKQLVDKDKVNYNVVINEKKQTKSTPKKQSTSPKSTKTDTKKQIISEKTNNKKNTQSNKKQQVQLTRNNKFKEKINNTISKIKNVFSKSNKKEKAFKKNNKDLKKIQTQKTSKNIKKYIPKIKKDENIKKKNIFFRLLHELKNNLHIIFNTILIVTFIITLIGLIRINVFKTGTIIYMCAIALFLMIVAISYNKYMSGKVFTILLTAAMSFAIYEMQYTYDFIRNLNSTIYEYKTYYVVTFNTSSNRSIYNINNKKVGLLEENCINIERKLNTKLDKVNYIEYKDVNELFNDFFEQEFRAIIVNENQYKYLVNKIEEGSRDVKILYEFEVNAKK